MKHPFRDALPSHVHDLVAARSLGHLSRVSRDCAIEASHGVAATVRATAPSSMCNVTYANAAGYGQSGVDFAAVEFEGGNVLGHDAVAKPPAVPPPSFGAIDRRRDDNVRLLTLRNRDMKQTESPSMRARASPVARRASMQRFQRLLDRVLIVGAASLAIAMTAFICVTTKVLG